MHGRPPTRGLASSRPTRRLGEYDRRLPKGLAFHTPEQKRSFNILADAYIHARYTKTYTITNEELDCLADRERRLQSITEETYREQIDRLA